MTCARKPDALRGVAGGDLRPPGTSVFDGSRRQQGQPHARSQMGRFVEQDEDSSKPDMLINRLSSGATRADLPARRSVSSRHSGGDSAVSARSEAPARCPVVECQNRSFIGTCRNTYELMRQQRATTRITGHAPMTPPLVSRPIACSGACDWFGQSTLEDRNLWPDGVLVVRSHFRSMADGTPIHASYPTLLRL